jgi:VIT1/CCC1 family predicted Fe2+/Mn2+ transporter
LIGAFGVFLLVFLSTFPVVIPFIFIHEAALALRISNAIAIVSLFAAGRMLARYTGMRPVVTGVAMVVVGVALVSLTIALGG